MTEVDQPLALERLKARNKLSDEKALERINAQLSNDKRREHAQVVISNNGTEEDLEREVLQVRVSSCLWQRSLRTVSSPSYPFSAGENRHAKLYEFRSAEDHAHVHVAIELREQTLGAFHVHNEGKNRLSVCTGKSIL